MRFPLPHTLLCSAAFVAGLSFVPPPRDIEVVLSERFPGASISYKETSLCETTDGVRSFSGFVNLPKDFLPDAGDWEDGVIGSLFFWYFEARNNPETAPTSIYLGGGPGYTSFDGSSVFPCYVNPDSNSTRLNEHSWNNNVNMLYIDQPFGVGYSHASMANGTGLANGTLNAVDFEFTPAENETILEELSLPFLQATVDTGELSTATNTSMSSARTLWRFAQVWFNEFPEITTTNDEISVWAVSYGGLFAPLFTSYTLDQNALIERGQHNLTNATSINMATVGVINAFIDLKSMIQGNVEFAYNNTFDLPAITQEIYEEAMHNITKPEDGAFALIDACQAAVAEGDPENTGANSEVNLVCLAAMEVFFDHIQAIYENNSPYSPFDVALNKPASHPTEYESAFFNQAWIQSELGVPLNFTRAAQSVQAAFLTETGDAVRYDSSHLSQALASGLNVAMVYGDLDYRCSWMAAENASLNIPFSSLDGFRAAGYAPIATNASYEGGLVREHAGLSFSRVFLAGHSAGGYQPETVSKIFERAMFRRDVATGEIELSGAGNYSTEGVRDITNVRMAPPEPLENICYVYNTYERCTEEQLMALGNGTAVTRDYVVVEPKGTKGERLTEGSGGDGNETDSGDGNDNGGGDNGDGSSAASKVAVGLLLTAAQVAALTLIQ